MSITSARLGAVPPNRLLWHLYVISAVVGVASVFFDVSYQSFVPVLVAPGKVGEANSKLEATAQLARIGGPAAGGALLTVLTAPLLFIGESLGYRRAPWSVPSSWAWCPSLQCRRTGP